MLKPTTKGKKKLKGKAEKGSNMSRVRGTSSELCGYSSVNGTRVRCHIYLKSSSSSSQRVS